MNLSENTEDYKRIWREKINAPAWLSDLIKLIGKPMNEIEKFYQENSPYHSGGDSSTKKPEKCGNYRI